MKLLVDIGDAQKEIKIERDGSDLVAEIAGRKYLVEASQPEENIYLLKYENRVFEIFVSPNWKSGEVITAVLNGNDHQVAIADPKSLRGAMSAEGGSKGAAEITTAMPGKVVKVLTELDTEVSEGDGVIVVEAMKMQNELKSPKNGIVTEVRYKEGDTVNAGDVLVVVE